MKGHRPAGGIPAGVAQIGASQGNHITSKGATPYRGEPLHNERNFQPVKFGNEVALNVGPGGCGTGRTIYKTGTQTTHGPTVPGNPPAKSTDILNQFGPNYRAPRS